MPATFMRQLVTIILTLLLLSACDQQSPTPLKTEKSVTKSAVKKIPTGQLGHKVVPTAYELTLIIDPDKYIFRGVSKIELEFNEALDAFYLHGKSLDVGKVTFTSAGKNIPATYNQVDPGGIARINLAEAVSGPATMSISYTAKFNQSLEGLYKVSESGKNYAFTQFEAISARLAFPGFDEPGFKTPFTVNLVVPENVAAISNTPETSVEHTPAGKIVHFAPTKPLPTYLIAFAVGDFDVVEAQPLPPTEIRPYPLPLRGIAVKGKGPQLKYALDGTNAIVTALETYFGTPYPWAKLDILAVPDFAAGAMENAGAITYRESLLLFDDTATPSRKRRYKMVQAHELAHQWFGDLVTPVWWNDIWLNESFASWMENVAMDIAEPQANYRRDTLASGLRVMATDSLVNTRQIRQPILSNNDISTAFDGITYSKGGAVLAMFENFLGREDFRQGVRNYMAEFKYGSATADDFIRHLANASTTQTPEAVIASFNSFLEQPGLPLVELASQCSAENVELTLKQSRYFPLGSKGKSDQLWNIPVCLRSGNADNSRKTCLLLTQKEQKFELPLPCPEWIIPNADSAGYYRFSMSKDDWNNLLAHSDQQNTEEMMAMLGSLKGAFNSGDLDVGTLMAIAPQLIANPDWQVSTAPMDLMNFMYKKMANPTQKKALQQRFIDFYAGKLKATGLATTNDRDQARLQDALVDFLAETAKQPELRKQLVKMASNYTGFGTDNKIHPQAANPIIIGTALAVAVDEIGNSFVSHLQKLALASTDAVVRGRLLSAMGNSKDPRKSAEIRELVFSPELRDNEIYNILFSQAAMDETKEATWAWFQQNIDKILKRVPEHVWGRFTAVGAAFCNRENQQEIENFFKPRIAQMAGGPRNLAKTLEGIDLCIAKVKQHKPEMEAWLGQ